MKKLFTSSFYRFTIGFITIIVVSFMVAAFINGANLEESRNSATPNQENHER